MLKLPLPELSNVEFLNFWSRISNKDKEDECWLWTGARFGGRREEHRRPSFRVGRKCYIATRLVYLIYFKEDPGEYEVCHHCYPYENNPLCMNPQHFWLGTHQENLLDGPSYGYVKINDEKKAHIKELFGVLTIEELAKEFNVCKDTIRRIVYRGG